MAPYDVPHVAHDMILRFMGVNFSAITEGSARIPSSVGTNVKPLFVETSKPKPTLLPLPGKTPQQDKAMWEGMRYCPFLCVPRLIFPAQRITTLALLHWFLS